ncbi:MAG: glycosyltransferase family 2 protein [bacterium]|nr:glycosyltransferase family 2 protein [bacterium]
MQNQKRLVVIPAHNEEETIYEVVTRALQYADVSVTDDGSRDQTPQILEEIAKEVKAGKHANQLNIITHEKATHIPRGLQDGIRYGVEAGYEWFVTMDTGLSHDPDALPQFFDTDPKFGVVIGSRNKPENVPLYRRVVSWSAARVVNYALAKSYFNFFGPGLNDCTSGFRRYSRAAAELIASHELKSKAFDFHMEALALCYRAGLEVTEIPIHYIFSNSSFNSNVLKQGMRFGLHLITTKG